MNLEKGEPLDFLGFTLQYHRSLNDNWPRYLSVMPSKKSMARARDLVREMTSRRYCYKPIPYLIEGSIGGCAAGLPTSPMVTPRRRFRAMNYYVRLRLVHHLRHRSQRPYRLPKGVTSYEHLLALGWKPL